MGVYVGSDYKGVCSPDGGKTWQAKLQRIPVVGRCHAGTYGSEELAARAYDKGWYLATKDASGPNLGPLTPAERCECDATTLAAFAAAAKAARVKFATGSSAYRGVGWRTTSKKWEARVSDKAASKSKHLGYFDSEVEAAKAYDAAARVLFGAAAILNFPDGAAAGAGEAESDEDDTPASAERVQRWQRKGLLYLQPLPADDGTSVVLRGPDEADEEADASEGESDDADSDDASDSSGGSELLFFDEQFAGEADGADYASLTATLESCATPAALADALERSHGLAEHPGLPLLVARFIEQHAPTDVPMLHEIHGQLTRIYAASQQAAAEASTQLWPGRIELTPALAWALGRTGGIDDPLDVENQINFVPTKHPEECPDWPERPFCYYIDRWRRMRGSHVFEAVVDRLDTDTALHYDFINDTFNVRPDATSRGLQRLYAEQRGAVAVNRVYRYTLILRNLKRKVAIRDYQGFDITDPHLLEEYQVDAAVAALQLDKAQYERELDAAAQQQADEEAAAAAAAAPPPPPPPPVRTFDDWRDLPEPAPPLRLHHPDPSLAPMPQSCVTLVGRLTPDGLEAMLAATGPRDVITLGDDGVHTAAGPTNDWLEAAIARGSAAHMALSDAVGPEARLGTDADFALRQQLRVMDERLTAAAISANYAQIGAEEAYAALAAAHREAEEEDGPEGFEAFLRWRLDPVQRRSEAARAAAAQAEVDAEADAVQEADAAEAARLAAATAAGQFDDADADMAADEAEEDPHGHGAAFADAPDDAEMASLEAAAAAKRQRLGPAALRALITARIASSNDVVKSSLRDVFHGFGAEGTAEEAAVRTALVGGYLEELRAAAAAAAEAGGAPMAE